LFPGEARIDLGGKPARVLGDQIRSIDKSRLRSRIERLTVGEMVAVEEALRITLDLHP
jgi:mRNA-degrading endonuclease toxin of MazEF toxin-antitoxin module